ncbi:2-polyprenyl-3-methyl-6-methoxy-1,4-benzoquinone monooxygenase [Methylibium sp.]|uniref:2-polyprenyl-3-methyl-6-methoxy-1,4-benzoquinone monooxygenase n=1 Tax=Methylibium sp. TaxID=2067992 RepID=UPI003D14F36C
MPTLSRTDQVISLLDKALSTVFGTHSASRPTPRPASDSGASLSPQERALSVSLMRVNHVGEVCAQALYDSQALSTSNPALKAQFAAAAREETDHLAWTEARLTELGGRTSWLNPLWYAGAFGLGVIAGRIGDAASLGFVVETERQVEQHLMLHLDRLPATDAESRAIVAQMREDEARHANAAERAGGAPLPLPVRWAMRGMAKLMTATAHHI